MQWTTKEGVTMDVKDMSDEHVTNTINMLRKKVNNKSFLNLILKGSQAYRDEAKPKEIFPHGDMAQQFNEVSSRELFESAQFTEIPWEDFPGDEPWLWP